jgi:hypothetical protein
MAKIENKAHNNDRRIDMSCFLAATALNASARPHEPDQDLAGRSTVTQNERCRPGAPKSSQSVPRNDTSDLE